MHWPYYDENFRFLRQKTVFPWDQIHWELWLQAHHMQIAHNFSRVPRRPSRRATAAGDFTEGKNVPAAILNTTVSNAVPCAQPVNAPCLTTKQILAQAFSKERTQILLQANQLLSPALSRLMSTLPTSIKVDKLEVYLEGYPARSKQYLLDGFRFVFSINYAGPRTYFSCSNRLSAREIPKLLTLNSQRRCVWEE